MGILSWLSDIFSTTGYKSFEPQKQVWYRYYDRLKSIKDSGIREFPEDADAYVIKPYAYLDNKKSQARFFLTNTFCIITTKYQKLAVPIKDCSFKYKSRHYKKDGAYGQGYRDIFWFTVMVQKPITKEDYLRFKKFKKKKIKYDQEERRIRAKFGEYDKEEYFIEGEEKLT